MFVEPQNDATNHREQRNTPILSDNPNVNNHDARHSDMHDTPNPPLHNGRSSDRSFITSLTFRDNQVNNNGNGTGFGCNMQTPHNNYATFPISFGKISIAGGHNYVPTIGDTSIVGGNNYSALRIDNNNNDRPGRGNFNMIGGSNNNICFGNNNAGGNSSSVAAANRNHIPIGYRNTDHRQNSLHNNNHGVNNPVGNYTGDVNIIGGSNNNIVARNNNTGGDSNNIAGNESSTRDDISENNELDNDIDDASIETSSTRSGISANEGSRIGRIYFENQV